MDLKEALDNLNKELMQQLRESSISGQELEKVKMTVSRLPEIIEDVEKLKEKQGKLEQDNVLLKSKVDTLWKAAMGFVVFVLMAVGGAVLGLVIL